MYLFNFHTCDSRHMSDGSLRNISFSSLSPNRNVGVKSRLSICHLITEAVNIITHLFDMHFWPMSGTHLYTPWISIFSISLFFVSITTFVCTCSDVSKLHVLDHLLPLLLEVVLSTDKHDPKWYRLNFYFQLLVLYSTNDYIFQLI